MTLRLAAALTIAALVAVGAGAAAVWGTGKAVDRAITSLLP